MRSACPLSITLPSAPFGQADAWGNPLAHTVHQRHTSRFTCDVILDATTWSVCLSILVGQLGNMGAPRGRCTLSASGHRPLFCQTQRDAGGGRRARTLGGYI